MLSRFEGIAKTNTTHTRLIVVGPLHRFEGIAKTNTTHTVLLISGSGYRFEGIAKTNTTHTSMIFINFQIGLRVLLKQIQHTPYLLHQVQQARLRVLLK